MIRTFEQEEVEEFAEHAAIPVINGLTDETHPLQALADAMTLRERFGTLSGVRLAYVGDGNNVCHSLMRIAARFGMVFTAATPPGYEPELRVRRRRSGGRTRERRQHRARHRRRARRCEARTPSTPTSGRAWARTTIVSGGSETSSPIASTRSSSTLAEPDAMALHCLPAHVGEEIAADVLYGPRCLAWEQAENRLHTQKALMALVIR